LVIDKLGLTSSIVGGYDQVPFQSEEFPPVVEIRHIVLVYLLFSVIDLDLS